MNREEKDRLEEILKEMFEENKPYNEILEQSKILDKYISEFYSKNKKSR